MALSDVKVIKVTTALADPLADKASQADLDALAALVSGGAADLTALTTQLNTENAERLAADAALADNIADEGVIRASGDAALGVRVDDEEAARAAADAALEMTLNDFGDDLVNEVAARTATDVRTVGVTPARVELTGPDRDVVMDADTFIKALRRFVLGYGADVLIDFDQIKSIARIGHKTVELAGALNLLSSLGLNADSLRSTLGQLIQIPVIRRALAIGDDSGRLALDVDAQNAVLSSDYTITAKVNPNWYEDARQYPVDYTPAAPVLITDTTNVNYVPRKFQGIASCVRTGDRYWAAWTGDIEGIERCGNFIVLAYAPAPTGPWTEYGYIAYDGDLTKGLTASLLWQAPDGALWVGMAATGGNRFFDGVLGSWVHVLTNPEAEPARFNWQTPFKLSRTGAPGKITPINGQFWISQDHWYSQAASKALYGNRCGKRIHRVHPSDRRAEYLFTLPENIGGRTYDETMFAQARDGSVLAIYRTTTGLESVRSYDGGKTWVEQQTMVPAIGPTPASRAWLGVSPSGRMVIVHNSHATDRRNLTLRLSDDGGRTWPYSVVLPADPSLITSYPWVMFGTGDEINAVYDIGRATPGYRRIECATVSEADVVAGSAVPINTIISYKGDVA
jgi:hypothetical protein